MTLKTCEVLTIVGARPQFIKAAPVNRALWRVAREVMVHTGQHYDREMSDVFLGETRYPRTDYNLRIGSHSHGRQTGQMLALIKMSCCSNSPPECWSTATRTRRSPVRWQLSSRT